MTDTSASDVANGIWLAWLFRVPLEIAGKEVFVSDQLATTLFGAERGEPLPPPALTAPAPDAAARQAQRQLARRIIYAIDTAGRAITALGVKAGALNAETLRDAMVLGAAPVAPGSADSAVSPAAVAMAAGSSPSLAQLSAADAGDDLTPQSGKE